jgi:hypothetical protein
MMAFLLGSTEREETKKHDGDYEEEEKVQEGSCTGTAPSLREDPTNHVAHGNQTVNSRQKKTKLLSGQTKTRPEHKRGYFHIIHTPSSKTPTPQSVHTKLVPT